MSPRIRTSHRAPTPGSLGDGRAKSTSPEPTNPAPKPAETALLPTRRAPLGRPAALKGLSSMSLKANNDIRYARFKKPLDQLSDRQLTDAIQDLAHAAAVLTAQWGRKELPGRAASSEVQDQFFLGALILAENKLTPGLELKRTVSVDSLCSELKQLVARASNQAPGEPKGSLTARFVAEINRGLESAPTPDFLHTVALEVRTHCTPSAVSLSVIVLEPLWDSGDASKFLHSVADTLADDGIDMHHEAYPLAIQKTASGCAIFSLSLAKKTQDTSAELAALHAAILDGSSSETATLPLSYYKHSSSAGTIAELRETVGAKAVDTEPVNKPGHTLHERTLRGRTKLTHAHLEGIEREMNVSYLAKRIRFFARASFVYQQEALRRGLAIPDGVPIYPEVPSSSVLPMLNAL
jgi:YopJ Serine/Threonine acetyltransferase